jgi:membrane-associated phospholipid phosphatase
MGGLQKWIASFVLTGVAVVTCYLWIDRPVALLAHNIYDQLRPLERFTYRIPIVMAPLAGLALLVLAARALMNRPLTRPYAAILLCAVSFFVTEGLKTYLKSAFGRTWPESWMGGFNRSFIRDGVYGFHPFHGGPAFTAFPSGHIAAVCAIVAVLWVWYPKFRPLYALSVLATAAVLICSNYHFVSDVIAGAFLGTSVGWITTLIWKAGVYRSANASSEKIGDDGKTDIRQPRTTIEGSALRRNEDFDRAPSHNDGRSVSRDHRRSDS